MKKELKLLGKYIVISVFITLCLLQLLIHIGNGISSYYFANALSSYESAADEKLIVALEATEMVCNKLLEESDEFANEMAQRGYENYPSKGAVITYYASILRLANIKYVPIFYIPLGILIGIVYYLCKKDFKRLPHYLSIFAFMFIIICIVLALINTAEIDAFVFSLNLDWDVLLETAKFIIIPYLIFAFVTYISICLIARRKTELLNNNVLHKEKK